MKTKFFGTFVFILELHASISHAGIRDRISLRNLIDKKLLYPTQEPISSHAAKRRVLPSGTEVWIHKKNRYSDSGDVPPEDKVFILHFTGNAARAELDSSAITNFLPDYIDAEVWSVNYPGFGGSSGSAHLDALPSFALDAYSELLKYVDLKSSRAGERTWEVPPIYLSGFSLGSTVALYLATQRPARGIVLHNPPPIQKMIMGDYGWWNLWVLAKVVSSQVPKELDSYKNVKKASIPALFLTSENDQIVPPAYQSKLIARYAGKRQAILLPGVDHVSQIPASTYSQMKEAASWLMNEGGNK